ncbi:FadR/GntR family transcriptional regulator [Amycolatopsis nigrescens]|uniref:FadR/GntR family transcriptional regulator n=1 Tax=Amycolatopsis nigrescens TaxID=381445 RepID=UPI0003680DF7|nr:FadR/GntR family transcriptional regulator [Amycolatopsis nigrescens]
MEAVLTHLRGAIEQGEYEVGSKLPAEAALAKEFEVSRSVVREALRALQALGLTTSKTGKGTFVTATGPAQNPVFGPYSARDLVEVRRHVEIPVAGYAASRRSSDDLDLLDHLVRQMDAESDNTAWVALDTLFHITIAQASGNPVFAKFIEEIRDALGRQSTFLNQLGDRRENSNEEHRRIVAAIASGSREAAVEAMTAHLEHVEHTLTTIVRPARAPHQDEDDQARD